MIGILSLTAVSCSSGNGPVLVTQEFENNCWAIGDTVRFDYQPSVDDALEFRLWMLQDYRFSNIHLKLLYDDPEGNQQSVLISGAVIDSVGNWLYPASWGKHGVVLKLDPSVAFVNGEKYEFKLFQYMREDELCEIMAIEVGS